MILNEYMYYRHIDDLRCISGHSQFPNSEKQ
ncbi:hypothetical protein T11_248 [Trichinella zimbabwensis]|uniref:Uncharacterized protein n=1 Tax=Trichinella zimbabwensis TaxID=268475 RepID=A0A0V1DJI4_9BILA|nr:hypothetical protein T11_248 [Trichinella zimbabwensis]